VLGVATEVALGAVKQKHSFGVPAAVQMHCASFAICLPAVAAEVIPGIPLLYCCKEVMIGRSFHLLGTSRVFSMLVSMLDL
jgi:hypothetical protein